MSDSKKEAVSVPLRGLLFSEAYIKAAIDFLEEKFPSPYGDCSFQSVYKKE